MMKDRYIANLNEFDKMHPDGIVKFQYRGYSCLIVRQPMGYLCGYVRIPNNHPLYLKSLWEYTLDEQIECHGGITYTGGMKEIDSGWWIGFDCAHFGDFVPADPVDFGIWRDEMYVTEELHSIVDQLILKGK